MKRFLVRVWTALRSKKGQSLVEYALILALVAIVVITALTALGGHTEDAISNVGNTIGWSEFHMNETPKKWALSVRPSNHR